MMKLSDWLFWDIDSHTLDLDKHAHFITGRVLAKGDLDDWRAIRQHYGYENLKDIVRELRDMDDKTLHFLSHYFEIPLNEFRCFKERPLKTPHWNY